jgi:hypothetical protein
MEKGGKNHHGRSEPPQFGRKDENELGNYLLCSLFKETKY